MLSPMGVRGSSDAYGSWKMICIRRRYGRSAPPLSCVMSLPSKRIWPLVGSMRRRMQPADGGLAAARLAHQAERLALPDRRGSRHRRRAPRRSCAGGCRRGSGRPCAGRAARPAACRPLRCRARLDRARRAAGSAAAPAAVHRSPCRRSRLDDLDLRLVAVESRWAAVQRSRHDRHREPVAQLLWRVRVGVRVGAPSASSVWYSQQRTTWPGATSQQLGVVLRRPGRCRGRCGPRSAARSGSPAAGRSGWARCPGWPSSSSLITPGHGHGRR